MIKTGSLLLIAALFSLALIGCARHPPKSDGGLAAGVASVLGKQ